MAEATPPTFAIPAVRVMAPFAEAGEDDFAPVARYLAVCGGVVATATEDEGSTFVVYYILRGPETQFREKKPVKHPSLTQAISRQRWFSFLSWR